MYSDGVFMTDPVTSENILLLSEKQKTLSEMRLCEIADLAEDAAQTAVSLFSEGYDVYEVLSLISEGILLSYTESTCPSEPLFKFHANCIERLADITDRAAFSKLLCEKLLNMGVGVSESLFLPKVISGERITYVKNALADEAFDVFSQDFNEPRVVYSKNFSEAVRAVAKDECQYCLLPLEERGGARIFSTSELIFREDLKINSVTPVFGFDGNTDMKYALISKHFSVPEICSDDDRYLEIRLSTDSSIPLSDLFVAADCLSVSLYRINTVSYITEDGKEPHYSIVFRDEGGDFSAMLAFLTLFSGAYTPIGIYKNLE